jgi:polysaccharide export outer membrane protein
VQLALNKVLRKPLASAALVALGLSLACALSWRGAGAAGHASTASGATPPKATPAPLVAYGALPARPAWPFAGSGYTTPFGQGTYVEPGRLQHVPEYRLRVDDVVELMFRRTHEETGAYQLNVGDELQIELPPPPMADPGKVDETLKRKVVIQPDGNITLPFVGQVRAARLTIDGLAASLAEEYRKYYKEHMAKNVTVTPLLIDARLADLINAVDSRFGAGGYARVSRVTPDGSIALPAIGSVPVVGLTLDELKSELSLRYQAVDVRGIEVQPMLQSRAPRHVFVLGEVRTPGRYTLEGPTTAIQAIALAGGVTTAAGANLKQVVIFRRTHEWHMIATMVDLYDPIIKGTAPCAAVRDLWVADSDIVVVPKTKILIFDEFVSLIFTNGAYGILPLQGVSIGFAKTSTL